MKNDNYQKTIAVTASPEVAMKRISEVNQWWAKNFTGSAQKLNDNFRVTFGDTFVDFRVSELVPAKKLVWKVTDCNLQWIHNKKEWNNTEVVFEITPLENCAQIHFTHYGLVPDVECYNDCEAGWNGYIAGSLVHLINDEKGTPQ